MALFLLIGLFNIKMRKRQLEDQHISRDKIENGYIAI